MDTWTLVWCLLPNVPGDVVQNLGVRIVATLVGPLIAQQIFAQVVFGDPELLLRLFVGVLDDSVSFEKIGSRLGMRLQEHFAVPLWHVLGELFPDNGPHARHLVQAVEADDGCTTCACSWSLRWRHPVGVMVLGLPEDLPQLMKLLRSSTREV
jgi:hypothetical protein